MVARRRVAAKAKGKRGIVAMAPDWRYFEGDGNFAVYADANGGSSRRRFRASDGAFVDETPGDGPDYVQAFKSDLKRSVRLGELTRRPNLQDAVHAGRLPGDVLGELKTLLRSIAGITL